MRTWLLMVLFLWGCSGSSTPLVDVYDACSSVGECVPAATRCEELTIEFGGRLYTNFICTLSCEAEGALSPDCPRAFVGRFGSCYPASIASGDDTTPICFEPCDNDESCLEGFRCLGAIEICGASTSCPINPLDSICVPGPF
jgi:hypothetical protein